MKSLEENKQFKKNILNCYIGLKKIIEDEFDKNISFIKTSEENTEKNNKDLSNDDEMNNREKREESEKRDNMTSNGGNEFTKDEKELFFSNRKRKRSE